MSTAPISFSSIYRELQAYFQQRSSEVTQLGQDLNSGDLANAQQDFATLQSLGQGGPFANGDVFAPRHRREQDFEAIGQALQSGNLAAAQQAFTQLENTYKLGGGGGPDSAASTIANATATQGSSPVASSATESLYQQLRDYYKQRKADVAQLGQDLSSGNIAQALQDFSTLVTLGQSGPFKSGNPFSNSQREQDFAAVGQALQSGDLAGAQQAFAQLESTFQKHQTEPPVYDSGTNGVVLGSLLNTTA
ncbi:MAG TPA: hypothetical protein VMI10_23545 [Terriglobales bacterium]|nr:hypothetical protein [Terriglobales bacterium]